MTKWEVSRRAMLLGSASAVGAALASRLAIAQQPTRLRMFWWGSKERADRTFKVNELYSAKNPEIKIDGETIGWADYWPRMATQAAGRNLPDIIQMDYRYIFEYARRGALRPLNDLMPKLLDIADFGENSINSGAVDGKLYGVNLGNNSTAMIVAAEAYKQAGVTPPEAGITWEAFGDRAAEFTKAAGKDKFFGTQDAGGVEPAFEGFVRQRGKELYAPDGKLGFTAEDATEWFAYWDKLRKAKACPPADLQALDKLNIETNLLTIGNAAIAFAHSNQLVGYQAVNQKKLALAMQPSGAKPGQYLKPSMLFSISAGSKNAEAAAQVINFYVKDAEAVKALGVERGVPASKTSREIASGALDDLGKAMLDYVAFVTDKVGPLPPPPPKGAGEIQFVLKRINEEVGFAKTTAQQGGTNFVAEAASILSRG
jgi:multiple sugar transport system substrate-binding protein